MNKYSGLIVWIVTALLAVGIIGFAVMISRQNTEKQAPVKEETVKRPPAKTPGKGVAALEQASDKETQPPSVPTSETAPMERQPQTVPKASEVAHIPGISELAKGDYPHKLGVSSPRISEGLRMPLDFTCYRSNTSPPVVWTDEPRKTKTLVLMMTRNSDPNDPFVNWLLFNIPASQDRVRPGMAKKEIFDGGMAHAKSDYRNIGYIGPCEPKGKIPYSFRLFALDTKLDLAPASSKDEVLKAMDGHIIDYAEFNFVHYQRF